ncbi:MAG: TerC family protein [Flavobacteriales bacterium]|nr:TerC family protein [Flavobacteriales bacterium]MCX7769050.1 TerC family protein [Flavobacteriales bacterium]MDW8410324.1 TerC family protein [Flavobacteriales bacterium]
MDAGVLISLVTLVGMEIVLGVDNILFISILTEKVPRQLRQRTRVIGLSLALLMRIGMLLGIAWIARLTKPLVSVGLWGENFLKLTWGEAEGLFSFSGRDLLLVAGGVFLVVKTLKEIVLKVSGREEPEPTGVVIKDPGPTQPPKKSKFRSVVAQIIFIDMIFSFDSILTAVGLVDDVKLMIAAVVVSMIFMMVASGYVSDFINRFPGIRMLALLFLVLIGAHLFFEGVRWHPFEKEHLYFALVFGLLVEWLDILYRKAHPPIEK